MELLKNIMWVLSTILIPIATFIIGKYKKNKSNNELQNEALKLLLQNNLTNTAYVYLEIGEIPDYVYRGWLNQFKIYKKLGGNDFIDELHTRMEKLVLSRTDIIK